MKESKEDRVVLNLRTTKAVKEAAKRQAQEQDRSLNWILDKAVREGLGIKVTA